MGMVKDVWDIPCDIGGKVFQSFHKRREQGKTEKVLSVMTRNKTLFGEGWPRRRHHLCHQELPIANPRMPAYRRRRQHFVFLREECE